MANGLSNNTRMAWTLRMPWLGLLVVQLALCSGAITARGQPAFGNYADLPELSGPFAELKNVPESLKEVAILGASEGELVILPTSVRLYREGGGFRLEHNLLAAAGVASGPMARLELFIQPTVDEFASVMPVVSKAFPGMKIGRPRIMRPITAEFITSSIFPGSHTESILTSGSHFSISDVVFVTFESNHFFMRALFNGNADIIGVRASYEIPVQGTTRQYVVGKSFAFDCRTSPESFLDLMNSKYGCPDFELWKLASPDALSDRLSECVSKADVPFAMPEAVLNRWKEWKRRDCAITLFSGQRRS